MPHVFGIALIATGLYAGGRWLARKLVQQAEDAAQVAEEMSRRARSTHTLKDLGALEYDTAAQVYRPKTRR